MREFLTQRIQASTIKLKLLHHAEVLPINGPSYRLKDWLSLARSGSITRTS